MSHQLQQLPEGEDNLRRYKRVFNQFASIHKDSENYLTKDDFISAISPRETYTNITRDQYGVLFRIADRNHRGLLSFNDFVLFENLLSRPDAEYIIAYKVFDPENTGKVTLKNIKSILKQNWNPDAAPFNFNTEWFKLYVGSTDDNTLVSYDDFCQLLKGLTAERLRQAFRFYDKGNKGYITPDDFKAIVVQLSKNKLSDYVIEHAPTLANVFSGNHVSYGNVIAFYSVIRQLDTIELIVSECFKDSKDGTITRAAFVDAANKVARFTLFTPMEVEIIFHFAGLDNPTGKLTYDDFARLLEPTWKPMQASSAPVEVAETKQHNSMGWAFIEKAYGFVLGSIAGAVGATVVYPIDLVKTRMQNQRTAVVGQILYKNSFDCFSKVIKNEGFLGLYKGLLPQLVGVAPEKAIKLTMNDLMRGVFTDKKTGEIELWQEVLSGGIAGASQVIFTNPLEIVKIRLQIQGELSKSIDAPPKRSALWIVRHLGLVGLYKGAGACLLRDIPFSAIYFSAYSHLKKDYFKETATKKLAISELLLAGAIAGMPAAYLTTPADVIKTRLQVEARKGETTYNGIVDAARKILREEGFAAFFKGGAARVFRSSPQFGCTLMVYELLQRSFPLSKAEEKITKVASKVTRPLEVDQELLRSRHALKLLLNMDHKFGTVTSMQLIDKFSPSRV
ncbi:mitochondrial carrier [Conidiobolus coronatus NRRL 28638]|uniref:Mitochondrial aspartate-glutamate transporter AGC1 n=1 Tax=Conidiobolus coronatus (strain ATCC 28846 / CBS 209.66 / NRRL 28638) TaxID=796925 RepID=A0A137PBX1_CONC2|nr:mitochondrial carrier [Conidiobolus coronatus NRRL 28638]|eukprot:KXN72465.1 mitochondrial carrier [Conidiobolus coronatus NRRL 28638]